MPSGGPIVLSPKLTVDTTQVRETIVVTYIFMYLLLFVKGRQLNFLLKVSKYKWCLTSTETIRLIRNGEKGGRGVLKGGKREVSYIPIATPSLSE